jgi:hypothetical protein
MDDHDRVQEEDFTARIQAQPGLGRLSYPDASPNNAD